MSNEEKSGFKHWVPAFVLIVCVVLAFFDKISIAVLFADPRFQGAMGIAEDKAKLGWLNTRIARFETRKYDFDALKFQADYDPKYRRAQMRYMGTGATGVVNDGNTVPAETLPFQPWCYLRNAKVHCISTTMWKKCFSCYVVRLICSLSITVRNFKPN